MYSKNHNCITRIVGSFVLPAVCVLIAAGSTAAKTGRPDQLGVFRPSTGTFYSRSADESGAFTAIRWGLASDVLAVGDYDGDGIQDAAVWRPETGIWYILRSSDAGALFVKWGVTIAYPTGGLPDVPVPADYDGDGQTDIAVWRPDTGQWYVLFSSTKFNERSAGVFQWGKLGDVPVQADYDGDGRADFAIFRPTENQWYIFESSTGGWKTTRFGIAGRDRLVPADYTGDGRADIAVYRSGAWYVLSSETAEIEPFQFGFADATPAPGDYDGDGRTDFAVYRKGSWYIYDSAVPRFRIINFGSEDDIPIGSLLAKQSMVAVP